MTLRRIFANPRVRIAASAFAAATIFGLLFSTQSLRAQNHAVTWATVLAVQLPPWYIWMLFAPIVAWTDRRFPLLQPRWFLAVPVHLLVVVVLMFVLAGIETTLLMLASSTLIAGHNWVQAFWAMLRLRIGTDLLAYAMILGMANAYGYHIRLRERERAAAQLSVQLTEARLQALRMQLNPHFLFNAMNSVAMLVRREKNADAVNLIAGLGTLLRYVLDGSHALEIPLRQELDFVKQYFAVEQVRFPDRLHYFIDAAPDSLDTLVPNLILQPLVENAIRHGIAKRANAGRVEISARLDGLCLEVQVHDNGPGMNAPTCRGSSGVGLRNTRQRLQRMYGEQSRFRLESNAGGGTTAILVFPRHITAVAEAETA